jgi:hypothetical protein
MQQRERYAHLCRYHRPNQRDGSSLGDGTPPNYAPRRQRTWYTDVKSISKPFRAARR